MVIDVDGAGDGAALGAWPRARLRKIKTPSRATKITAQTTNIPREEAGGRLGNCSIRKDNRF